MFGCLRGTMVVSIVWPSGYLVSFETVNYPDGFGRKFEGIQQAGGVFSYTEIFRSSKRNILIKCQKHNLRKSLVSYYKLKSSERIGRAELSSRLY